MKISCFQSVSLAHLLLWEFQSNLLAVSSQLKQTCTLETSLGLTSALNLLSSVYLYLLFKYIG